MESFLSMILRTVSHLKISKTGEDFFCFIPASFQKSHENCVMINYFRLMEIINKESGKETLIKSSTMEDLDGEQFLGSCQVSNFSHFPLRSFNFLNFSFRYRFPFL